MAARGRFIFAAQGDTFEALNWATGNT